MNECRIFCGADQDHSAGCSVCPAVCGGCPCHAESLYAGKPLRDEKHADREDGNYAADRETGVYFGKYCGIGSHPCGV